MRIITKKIAYLLLMLAIAGSSGQALYATSLHNCEHHNTATAEHHSSMDEQHSQHSGQRCDDNCGCDLKFSEQTSLPADLTLFQCGFSQAEISADIAPQYKQYILNTLLRPPIG